MKKGVTLVELLIAMFLSTIVITMLISALSMFNSTNDLLLSKARSNYYYQTLDKFVNDNKDKVITYDKNSFKLDGEDTNLSVPFDIDVYYTFSKENEDRLIGEDKVKDKYLNYKYSNDEFLKCILEFGNNKITVIIDYFELEETK